MRSIPPAVFTPASGLSAPLHGALHDAAPQSRLSLQLPPPLPYTLSFQNQTAGAESAVPRPSYPLPHVFTFFCTGLSAVELPEPVLLV